MRSGVLTVAHQLADNPGKTLVTSRPLCTMGSAKTICRAAGATNREFQLASLRGLDGGRGLRNQSPQPAGQHCTTVASHTAPVLGSIERLVA